MEPLVKCPICGSRKIERVRESVEVHPRGHALRVADVPFDRCLNCGETFFDHEASAKLDAAVARRRAPRRKSA